MRSHQGLLVIVHQNAKYAQDHGDCLNIKYGLTAAFVTPITYREATVGNGNWSGLN